MLSASEPGLLPLPASDSLVGGPEDQPGAAPSEPAEELPGPVWRRPYLLFAAWVAVTLGLASGLSCGWQPSLWLQPSVVGLLWGGLFVAGVVIGGVGQGRPVVAVVGLVALAILSYAFQRLTSFEAADALLFSTALLLGGWGSAKCYFPTSIPVWKVQRIANSEDASFEASYPGQKAAPACGWQWSIWDIAFASLLVAIFSSSVPELSAPPMLLIGVASTLIGGLLCSLAAYRWAVNDRWSKTQLLLLLSNFLVAAGLLFAYAPREMAWGATIGWLLSGPVNVMASQAVSVLVASALLRAPTLVTREGVAPRLGLSSTWNRDRARLGTAQVQK